MYLNREREKTIPEKAGCTSTVALSVEVFLYRCHQLQSIDRAHCLEEQWQATQWNKMVATCSPAMMDTQEEVMLPTTFVTGFN